MNLRDPNNKEYIEKTLREGAVADFWEIIKSALDENIENVEVLMRNEVEEIDGMPAEEVKLRILMFREKKKHYQALKEIPYLIVQSLADPEQVATDLDVYDKKEDFMDSQEL